MTTETDAVRRDVSSEGDPMQSPQRAHPKPEQVGAGDRLARIKARCDAATPPRWRNGPFVVEKVDEYGDVEDVDAERVRESGGGAICDVYGLESFASADAAFIAHSRQDVPWLVEKVGQWTAIANGHMAARRDFVRRLTETWEAKGRTDGQVVRDLWQLIENERELLASPSTTYTEGRRDEDAGVPLADASGGFSAKTLRVTAAPPDAASPTTETKGEANV